MTKQINVAFLGSDRMMPGAAGRQSNAYLFDEEFQMLSASMGVSGFSLEALRWRDAPDHTHRFDLMLPLMAWDYFEGNRNQFFDVIDKVSKTCRVLNPPSLMRWNSDKRYLSDLSKRGVPVIPTEIVDVVTPQVVEQSFKIFDTDKVVIKPLIGGGAWRQVLMNISDQWPEAEALPPSEAMIQPFLPSIQNEGEYSLIYFGGKFSHAARKVPSSGEYRIQAAFGGIETRYSPTSEALRVAEVVIEALPSSPLYARIDLIRERCGQLVVIEVELIEPYLYLPASAAVGDQNMGADAFTHALQETLQIGSRKA